MADLLLAPARLAMVQEIVSDEAGSVVRLTDGAEGLLPAGHRQYDHWMRILQRSRDRRHPVGLSLCPLPGPRPAGLVGEVLRGDNDFVRELSDDGAGAVRVFFQGHDGAFSLAREHPDFPRVFGVLEKSAREGTRVWFASLPTSLALADAVEASVAAANGAP